MDGTPQTRVVLNGVEFDLNAGLLRGPGGEDIALRPQSLAVLKHLAENAGRVIGKAELLDTVWPGIAVTENSLSQCISEIRKAIGDEGQLLLKTVSRRGYRLVLQDQPSNHSRSNSAGTTPAEAAPPKGQIRHTSAILAGLVVVAVLAIFFWTQSRDVGVPDSLSIAVLPFANLSEAQEQAYLANGITDDLTTELARVPGLFVVSRNAAAAYRGSKLAPAQIARKLGVRYLLGGSVQRAGDAVRINTELVDAATVGQLWAKRFDGTFAKVFDLQNDVVGEIVDALQIELVPGKANLAVSGDTDSAEAFQAYRRAIEARRANTVEGTVEALGYLRQALVLDPQFGAAAAEMAWLYWDADEPRLKILGIDWDESVVRRTESLKLASRNPSPGYFQLSADLLTRQHRSDEAISLLQKAIPLDPSDSWTYEGMSQALSFNGRQGEGSGFLATAFRVDPGWTEWRRYLTGLIAFGEGRYEDVIAATEQMDISSPDPWSKFYAMHLLVAAYAHLDRLTEMAAAQAKLKAVVRYAGESEPNLLIAQQYFVYKNEADIIRLLDGLRKAGVPEASADSWNPTDRLDGASVKKLIFGHRLAGRKLPPDTASYRLSADADGKVTKTVGPDTFEGHIWIQGDSLCSAYPQLLASCGYVFRNPGGSATDQNEYRYDTRFNDYEFSVKP